MRHMVTHLSGAKRVFRFAHGQALIETALVVPFLMMIFVGGAELARIAYAAIEVANAASAAVLYGAQNGGTAGLSTGTPGMVQAAKLDAVDLTNVSLTVNEKAVCVDLSTGASTTIAYPWPNPPCASSDATYTELIVVAQGTMNTLFHFPGIPSEITLYGQAQQRVVGN
jgi:Flp pilus assembly protein TadG